MFRYPLCLLSLVVSASISNAADPAHVQRLEKAFSVKYKFDDSQAEHAWDGHTDLSIDLQVRFSFRYRVSGNGSTRRLAVTPRITKCDLKLEHTIRLPESYRDESRRYRRLLYHEFDHVAISGDERPWLLLRHLIATTGVIRKSVPAGTSIDSTLINRMINDRIEQHKNAVLHLIQQNYELLDSDEVSRRGLRPIPDRAAFFESLYAQENLARMKFPYAARVKGFMKSSTYRKAKRYYSE